MYYKRPLYVMNTSSYKELNCAFPSNREATRLSKQRIMSEDGINTNTLRRYTFIREGVAGGGLNLNINGIFRVCMSTARMQPYGYLWNICAGVSLGNVQYVIGLIVMLIARIVIGKLTNTHLCVCCYVTSFTFIRPG